MTDKQNSEKIILGIDPGTNLMGYGVLRVTGNKAVMETMGIIDLEKRLKQCGESDPEVQRLGKDLLEFEQQSIDRLKGYLR